MATRKSTSKSRNVKTVPFATLKQQYAQHRDLSLDTPEGVNAMKSMRQFIRSNRSALIDNGWTSLADHEKGAPYGDVPAPVAAMIVSRKIAS